MAISMQLDLTSIVNYLIRSSLCISAAAYYLEESMPDTERKILFNKAPMHQPSIGYLGTLLFGIPFLGIGAVVVAQGAGVLIHKKIDLPSHIIMWIGTIFMGIGVFLLTHGIRCMMRNAKLKRLRSISPSEPWRWDYEWDTRGVTEAKWKTVAKAYFMSLAFAVFMSPFNYVVFVLDKKAPLFAKGIICIFDLITIALLCRAIYLTLQYLKYGSSYLSFDMFPFYPGEELSVRLRSNKQIGILQSLTFTMRYIEEVLESHGSGKDRSTRTVCYQLYADTRRLEDGEISAIMWSEIPIQFILPQEELTTHMSDSPSRYWEMAVHGASPGIDYTATFPLPVYRRKM